MYLIGCFASLFDTLRRPDLTWGYNRPETSKDGFAPAPGVRGSTEPGGIAANNAPPEQKLFRTKKVI